MNIYVGNLSWDLTEQDLQDMFAPYGEVISAKIVTDKFNNNRSKGFGFVEMTESEAGNAAIAALHGTEVQGRSIVVNESQPREGGSGGALAIGVGDRLIMLEYSTYSVISPEGCAAILWKSPDKVQLAAEAMGITSDRVREQGFLDEVVREPLGGGHRDFKMIALNLKEALIQHLTEFKK